MERIESGAEFDAYNNASLSHSFNHLDLSTNNRDDKNDTAESDGDGFGDHKTQGSVFDHYEVLTLLGGSENSGVYTVRKKTLEERGQDRNHESFWNKLIPKNPQETTIEDNEYTMKVLRINTVDQTVAKSARKVFQQLDVTKEMRHPNIVRVSFCQP